MRSETLGLRAAFWLVATVAWLSVLRLNWPGHLSVDSVLALREGRFHIRETWNPALFPWLLGVSDRVLRGTGLHVACVAAVFFGACAALPALRPRVSGWAPMALLLVLATPQVLIYQGIVWKDVAFANATIGGFVALALGVQAGPFALRWGALTVAAVLLAGAILLRQNGFVFLAPAVVALALARVQTLGWRRATAAAGGWLAGCLALAVVMSFVCQPQGAGRPEGVSRGVRLVQLYDIVGVIARDPAAPLAAIRRADPQAEAYLRHASGRSYSPERIDTLNRDPELNRHLSRLSADLVEAQWFEIVRERPVLYLAARWDAFRWVFATPVIDRCLPVHVGIEGPPLALRSLDLAPERSRQDTRLYNYTTWFLDTPVMSHLTYAGLALAVGCLLLLRRDPADIVVAALLAGALIFTATFAFVTLACDYRYLYALDLSALTGLVYLVIDPFVRGDRGRVSRRGAPSPARLRSDSSAGPTAGSDPSGRR